MKHEDLLAMYCEMEVEDARTPAQSAEARKAAAEAEEIAALDAMMAESGIRRVEQLLDGEMSRRVLTLTPEIWREMGPLERRIMLDWTVRRAKLFEGRSAFMSRNICAGELELPDALRAVM